MTLAQSAPVLVLYDVIESDQAPRVRVTVHGDPAVGRGRFGRAQETEGRFPDGFSDGPIGAIRVDDSEIALFVDAVATRIPPGEHAVGARSDQHPVKVRIEPGLELQPVLA